MPGQTALADLGVVARAAALSRRDALLLAGLAALTFIPRAAGIAGPVLMAQLLDQGIMPGDFNITLWFAGCLVLVQGASIGSTYLQGSLAAASAQTWLGRLRLAEIDAINDLGYAPRSQLAAGPLTSRVLYENGGLSQLVTGPLLGLPASVAQLAVASYLCFQWSPVLGAMALVVCVAMYMIARTSSIRITARADAEQSAISDLAKSATAHFSISGYMLWWNRGHRLPPRLVEDNEALSGARGALFKTWQGTRAAYASVGTLATIGAYVALAPLVASGTITVGVIVGAVALLASLFDPVMTLSGIGAELAEISVALSRAAEVLTPRRLTPSHPPATSTSVEDNSMIELRDASARYDLAPLQGLPSLAGSIRGDEEREVGPFSLRIRRGEFVGISGPNGVGKSSCCRLAAGLLPPHAGTATNRVEAERIVYLSSEPAFLGDTVAEALGSWRPSLTELEMTRYLSIGGSPFEVRDGGAALLNSNTAELSEGQQQWLAVMCAALARPLVLVLDEATNALAPESERQLLRAVRSRLEQSAAIILVAHRRESFADVDRVINIGIDAQSIEPSGHASALGSPSSAFRPV